MLLDLSGVYVRSWFKNTGLRSPNVGDQSKTREFWILGARWEAFLEMGKDACPRGSNKNDSCRTQNTEGRGGDAWAFWWQQYELERFEI